MTSRIICGDYRSTLIVYTIGTQEARTQCLRFSREIVSHRRLNLKRLLMEHQGIAEFPVATFSGSCRGAKGPSSEMKAPSEGLVSGHRKSWKFN